MSGYRNVGIVLAYLALCAWAIYRAEAQYLRDAGAMLSDIGWCVAAMIGARAANKWAERPAGSSSSTSTTTTSTMGGTP